MSNVFEQIIKLLHKEKVSYEVLEHEHVHTSAQAAQVRGTSLEEAAKALVLKTKSGKFFMLVVPGHLRADLKVVKKFVGEKNCSLAPPQEVLKVTGCKVGTVPPTGPLFELSIYADEKVFDNEYVVFSAGSHYKSVKMKSEDYKKIFNPIITAFSKSI